MFKLLLTFLLVLALPGSGIAAECVVLLHGLMRTSQSMQGIEERLADAGFAVVNISYASRSASIDELANDAVARGLAACETQEPTKTHFVTHSLGGILVRQYFAEQSYERLGHVVMLGPPNNGSEIVDFMKNVPGYNQLYGPSSAQLGTDADSTPVQLGSVDFDLGVIAGKSTVNPLFTLVIPGPDDGKVSVASTYVDGLHEHIVMPVTHTWMMYNKDVIDQVVHYLIRGEFIPVNE
jgi:pimeloyl-ACP methyl ester carboxylesterase